VAALRGDLLNPAPEALLARVAALAEALESLSGLADLEAGGELKPVSSLTVAVRCTGVSVQRPLPNRDRQEADWLADLSALALELGACRKLIEHGLTTIQVLAGILSGANAGYSSTGSPSPLAAQSKVYVQA